MTYRQITRDYAVSGQITPEELPALKEAGFTTIVNNRPDSEIPPQVQAAPMRAAAETAGLVFVDNPFSPMALDMDLVERQAGAMSGADGPVLAYCATGNRCTVLWALAHVKAGAVTPNAAVETAAAQGYDLRGLLPQLTALAPS